MYRPVGGLAFTLVFVLAFASSVPAQERTVVIPEDTAPFTVDGDVIVRLTGEGIAGSTIQAKVDGPAKIVAENSLRRIVKGQSITGPGNREFEIKPTGKGKVTVTITSTSPIPGQKPTITQWQFEVR